MFISPSRFRETSSSTRMTIKSYGPVGMPMVIVSEYTHNITFCGTSSINLRQPSLKKITYEFDIIIRKSMFLKVKGRKFNRPGPFANKPGQSSSARCPAVWGPYDNESPMQWPIRPISSLGGALVDSVHIASTVVNRIAPQGSHRYSRRGHNTTVLHFADHPSQP